MDFFIIGIVLGIIFIVLINYVFFYDRKKFRYRKNMPARQKTPAGAPPRAQAEPVPAVVSFPSADHRPAAPLPEEGWNRDTTPVDFNPDDFVPAPAPSPVQDGTVPAPVPSYAPDEFVPAGFYRRVAAFFIDITIIYLIIYLLLVNMKLTSSFELAFYPLCILYFTYYDAGLSKLKASPGKRLLSIVVVDSRFQQVSLQVSLARAFLKVLFFWVLSTGIGIIVVIILSVLVFLRWKDDTFSRYQLALWDKGMMLWDMVVKTRVVFDPGKEWVSNPPSRRDVPAESSAGIPEGPGIRPGPEPVHISPLDFNQYRHFFNKRSAVILCAGILVLAAVFTLPSLYNGIPANPPDGPRQTYTIRSTNTPTALTPPATPGQTYTVRSAEETTIPTPPPTLERVAAVSIPFRETISLISGTSIIRSFQADKAPVRISFSTEPKMITDKKVIFSGPSDNTGTEKEVTRADENAYSKIVVRDLTDGRVVAERGYGKEYSSETLQVITLMKEGHYELEISGSRAGVTVAISN